MARLPLRWRQYSLPRFPEVHHPIAVLLPESFRGGCSFGGLSRRLSPAWGRVLATPTAPPAGGNVAVHHKGARPRVNESQEAPKVTHILSGTSMPKRSR